VTAARRRLIATGTCEQFHVSQRRISRALDLARSSFRYQPVVRDEQVALARRIEELAAAHPRFGYRRIWALWDREGWTVNKKAVRRIDREFLALTLIGVAPLKLVLGRRPRQIGRVFPAIIGVAPLNGRGARGESFSPPSSACLHFPRHRRRGLIEAT
jgi:hypothetical protein